MEWVYVKIRDRRLLSPSEQPYLLSHPPPAPPLSLQSGGFGLNNKVSPSMLLIIVILAVIFFVSGLVHLLVRFLLRPSYRDPEDPDHVTALQGQLQQLFHLHDAGVDQSFIDTLPVFDYSSITGPKTPFDCAVCLCEFEPQDRLRLLPKCSHAFHMECIDTWLLSHSTCPLCRANLLPDFSPHTSFSPFVFVLESESEGSREIVSDRDSVLRTSSRVDCNGGSEFGSSRIESSHKSVEITATDESVQAEAVPSKERVVPVKLGKFRNVNNGGGEGSTSSSKNVDERRCFSMGSFEYVMDDNSVLQVPIRTPTKKQSSKKASLPLIPGRRAAMSECDCESRREFNGFDQAMKIVEAQGHANTSNSSVNVNDAERSKRESFSISKIWLRGKESMHSAASRASSFHFPAQSSTIAANDKMEKNRRAISEMGIGRCGNGGSELGGNQSCSILDSQANQPSFARKTLLWLVGRQNKVVHSSMYPHV